MGLSVWVVSVRDIPNLADCADEARSRVEAAFKSWFEVMMIGVIPRMGFEKGPTLFIVILIELARNANNSVK